MAQDIVCSESELSIVANKLVPYAEFIVTSIQEYINILADIQEKGIEDDLICSKLSNIAELLKPCESVLVNICESVANEIREYIDDIADADNFEFPEDITSSIASLVSKFL